MLTPGNMSDITAAYDLISRAGAMSYLIADKGYDADAFRQRLRAKKTVPVIPGRSNRKRKIRYDKTRYKDRHLVENAFCRLKDFRRIATRYDKLSRNFLSTVALATLLAYWMGLSLGPSCAVQVG
jgi:transposase